MPTFGEFETVGEPVSITRQPGHVSRVWRARRVGGGDERTYAIKCYAPRPRSSGGDASSTFGQDLGRDRGLEFLEGIKQLEEARAQGVHGPTRIRGWGKTGADAELDLTSEGAWYATDFCESKTLKEFINTRGRVDDAGLRQVVASVLATCRELQGKRGCSHGNLKPSNVLLAGPARPLRRRPLLLTDPFPAAPAQLDRLEARDRQEVGGLIKDVLEARDLRGLGELILQLVEGQIASPELDCWPVESSPAWARLGKDADFWLGLCNRLLDPQLTPEKISFEKLSEELGVKAGTGPGLVQGLLTILRRKEVWIPSVAVVVIGAAGLGVKQLMHNNDVIRSEALKGWTNAWDQGQSLLDNTNFQGAVKHFEEAEVAAQKAGDKSLEADAAGAKTVAQALREAGEAVEKGSYAQALRAFSKLTALAGQEAKHPYAAWARDSERSVRSNALQHCESLVNEAETNLDKGSPDLPEVRKKFDAAESAAGDLSGLLPGIEGYTQRTTDGLALLSRLEEARNKQISDPSAAEQLAIEVLRTRKNNQLAISITNSVARWRADQTKNRATSLKHFNDQLATQWKRKEKELPADLVRIASDEFVAKPALKPQEYGPPLIWEKISSTNQNVELGKLKDRLQRDRRPEAFRNWRSGVEHDYASFNIDEEVKGFGTIEDILRNAPSELSQDLTNEVSRTLSDAIDLRKRAQNGGERRDDLKDKAVGLVQSWNSLHKTIGGYVDKTKAQQLVNSATALLAIGKYDDVLTICKTNTSQGLSDLCATATREKESLAAFQGWLDNCLYEAILSNKAFRGKVAFTNFFATAEREDRALTDAKAALQRCDYDGAISAVRPYETKLAFSHALDQARQGLNVQSNILSCEKGGRFEAVRALFDTNSFLQNSPPGCLATRKSEADRAASALQAVQTDLGDGDYRKAQDHLRGVPTAYSESSRFSNIALQIQRETDELQQVKRLLQAGSYDDIESQPWPTNRAFKTVTEQAANEHELLKDYNRGRTNDWYWVSKWVKDNHLVTNLWSKPPFKGIKTFLHDKDPQVQFDTALKNLEEQVNNMKTSAGVEDARKKLEPLKQFYATDKSAYKSQLDRLKKIENHLKNLSI